MFLDALKKLFSFLVSDGGSEGQVLIQVGAALLLCGFEADLLATQPRSDRFHRADARMQGIQSSSSSLYCFGELMWMLDLV
jgi:hypothetical protein